MDVTPQVLHEVEFRAKVRGYDPDEVDDFLERVAAGVSQLQDRLKDATERAEAAESTAAELRAQLKAGAATADADDTLKRTLVLAQRTADAVVKEANEEATRTLGEAHDKATTLVTDAERQASAILKDAEDEVRKGVDATRKRLLAEIIDLEATRDSVRADVAALERHLDEQRLRLRGAVTDLQRLVDDPAALKGLPTPILTEATLPARFEAEAAVLKAPAVVPEDEPVDEADDEVAAGAGSDAAVIDLDEDDDDEEGLDDATAQHQFAPDDDDDDGAGVDIAAPAGAKVPSPMVPKGRIGLFDDLEDDDDRRGFEFDEPGPAEPMAHIPEGPEGDDAYLAELRKATLATDDDLDDDLPPLSGLEADPPKSRSRFGRRR